MSTRLQVILDEPELQEIRAAAERRRMNVSEWVRFVLREERARERTGRSGASSVRESLGAYRGPTTSAPNRVRVEIEVKESLLDAVQERYRLPTRRAAVEFALRRVAVVPMSKDEALAMQGDGWDGDLASIRSGDDPQTL